MYNFQNSNELSKKELLQKINSLDVFLYYFGEFKEGEYYCSPFPFRKDIDPSFRIDYLDDKFMFRDFGIDVKPRDCIHFVQLLYDLDFNGAIRKINNDMSKLQFETSKPRSNPLQFKDSAGIVVRNLSNYELDYWAKAKITKEDLKKFKVFSSELWFKKKLLVKSKFNDPVFVYLFNKNEKIWKTYRPLAPIIKGIPKYKFWANNVTNHIQGWEYLPKSGNILFITKSYKDVIVLYKLGFDAIAPHSESTFLEPEIIKELKQRFKHIYVNYDLDSTGVNKSIKFTKKFNLNYWNVPCRYNTELKPTKDPFDMVVNYSYEEIYRNIKDKLKRDGI